MSYINDVRLVGEITSEPEKKSSQKGTAYLVFDIRTGRFQANGQGKGFWVFQHHRVVVFNQASIDACAGLKLGAWVSVLGELTYLRGANTGQITVSDRLGDARPMFPEHWAPTPDVTDEEIALIAAAEGGPIATKVTDKPKEEAAGGAGRDVDDEIPF